ncbi:MAG: exodeoxyribonuclease VII small subunit [Acidobacteria bacterium]|nr:exodeoxyribonuclease VII small subunit [Acidobacteriota bacterium]MBV9435700.1 exodeoxyribonuclease VII small subunit [Acidobacteriota bacterium]
MAKFEDCLQQLEKIVEQLERGDLPLEQSLKLFEEGVRLSNACRQELEAAEGKVEILTRQGGKLEAQPFESLGDEKSAGK